MLQRSVVVKCCREVLYIEKICCREVLKRTVGEKCCREVLEFCGEVL